MDSLGVRCNNIEHEKGEDRKRKMEKDAQKERWKNNKVHHYALPTCFP